MISNSIRKLMIEFPERLREIILTEQELDSFKEISHYSVADPFRAYQVMPDKTAHHKSRLLFGLWKKGYIKRRKVIAASGGYEFEYWPVKELISEKV